MSPELFFQFAVYGVLLGGTYGLLAIPLGVMHATTGAVDAAVGAYAVLASCIVGSLGLWPGIPLGLLAAVAASLVTAGVHQALKKRLTDDTMPFILSTFGIMMVLQGIVQAAFGTDPVRLGGLSGATKLGVLHLSHQSLLNFVIGLVLAVGLALLLYRSPVGLSLRAGSNRPAAAALVAIPLFRLQLMIFLVEGLLAGVAGLLYVLTIGVDYTAILSLTLAGLGGAVLCGLRGPLWAFAGGVAFGVLESVSVGVGHGGVTVILPYLLAIVVLSLNREVSVADRP